VTVEAVACERASAVSFGGVTAPTLLPEYIARKSVRRANEANPAHTPLIEHEAGDAAVSRTY
jgi:hypothetical protein